MLTYQYTFGFEDFCENIYKQLTSFFLRIFYRNISADLEKVMVHNTV